MSDYTPPVPADDDAEPTPQEGARPEADTTIRPEQREPVGPLEGLMKASAASAEEEAAELSGGHDAEAEALLAQMGVEEEGIASGQLLGLVLVVLLSVAALAVVLIYLFIIPFQTQTDRSAEASSQYYEEQNLEAEAIARLSQYAREGDVYRVPIGRAQALVAASYAEGGMALPRTRQQWNTSFGSYTPEGTVQELPGGVDPTVYRFPADGVESVGVDVDTDETVDVVGEDEDFDGAFE